MKIIPYRHRKCIAHFQNSVATNRIFANTVLYTADLVSFLALKRSMVHRLVAYLDIAVLLYRVDWLPDYFFCSLVSVSPLLQIIVY